MSEEINLQVQPQKLEDGWLLYRLVRLEISVTVSPADYESRKVTAALEPPESAPIQLAIPIYPGAGTQPENTVVLINVQDQVVKFITQLENAIDETVKNKKQGDW